jgi:hypothetical protein
MTSRPGQRMAGGYASIRASSADRDRAIEVLKKSFVEGRLDRHELDERLGQAFVSRFFAELMALIADLPVGPFGRLPAHPSTPRRGRSRRQRIAMAAHLLVGLVVLFAAIATMLAV